MSAKLNEDIGYHGGNTGYTILATGQGLILTCWAVRNLKCGISRKRLIVKRNRRKFGTQGTTVHMHIEVIFDAQFLEIGLGSFCALNLQNFQFYTF